jgi:atypical dual specificity phosphatase
MNKIIEGLYLGDVYACSNRYLLRKAGITHILTMAVGMVPLYPKEFVYKCVDVYDMPTQNMMPHLPSAVKFIKSALKKGGNILVHCYAGVSRSATTVIAFLMVEKKASFMEAANYVRKKRPIIYPNIGFQKQLIELERILKEVNNDEMIMSQVSNRANKNKMRSTERRTVKSAYRGGNRAKSSNKIPVDKNTLTYKDKAKHYYLGMKNNWIEEGHHKSTNEYNATSAPRKSQTVYNPLKDSLKTTKVATVHPHYNVKINQKMGDGISVRSPSHYKRINRLTEVKKSKRMSSKHNNVNKIYQEVKTHYNQNKNYDKQKSSSVLKQPMTDGEIVRLYKYRSNYS